jgi:methylmalonyl-CoA mutase
MAAALGHTQSLHTNSLDEAIALPTDFSARIARNTQLFLQEETGITKVVDPWGGSYYVEALTDEIMRRAWAHIQEVEALGGMAKAIETGLPKLRIEEAAARRQARSIPARRPSSASTAPPRKQEALEMLEVDNAAVRDSQIQAAAGAQGRARRAAGSALPRSAHRAAGGARATCSRWPSRPPAPGPPWARSPSPREGLRPAQAVIRSVSPASINAPSSATDPKIGASGRTDGRVRRRNTGRRPRILIAKMGQDGHDRGAKVVATAYADLGFDVDIGPLFQSPEEAARDGGRRTTCTWSGSVRWPADTRRCWSSSRGTQEAGARGHHGHRGRGDSGPGLRLPPEHGAAAVFGPGTQIPDAARLIIEDLERRLGASPDP